MVITQKEVKMQVSQITAASFKGRITNYDPIKGNEDLKNNSYWQKNSSVEKTLGSFRSIANGKAYFADPMEKVNDVIKESVDYIVYDNEPSYPDVNSEVSKNYFGTLRKDFKQDFEEIRKYYYRREMGGFANKTEAQYQQWQAAECVKLYDKGGDLRYKKEQAEDEITNLQKQIESETKNLTDVKAKLAENLKQKENLDRKMYYMYQKNTMYKSLQTLVDNPMNLDEEEKTFIKSQAKKVKKEIKEYRAEAEKYCKEIIKAQKYIIGFPAMIKNLNEQISNKTKMIEEIKAKLIPLFDELKNFYAKQGIKVIKK